MTAMPTPPDQLALLERLIRIETKLDDSRTDFNDHESRIRQLEAERNPTLDHRVSDHETRLRRVERSIWMASGVVGLTGAVLGSVLGPLINR